jgi:hypothetical protein
LSSWIDALHALRREAYRQPALTPDRLWSLLEHPRCDPTARFGAATLLRALVDEDGVARLRRTARAFAAPGMRQAIERITSSKASF